MIKKIVEFTCNISVLSGALFKDAGINVPFRLASALHEETRKKNADGQRIHLVEEFSIPASPPEAREKALKDQADAFYEKMKEIWDEIDPILHVVYALEGKYHDDSGGGEPPWDGGRGVVVRVGEREGRSVKYDLEEDNDAGQSVKYQVLVGIRFK